MSLRLLNSDRLTATLTPASAEVYMHTSPALDVRSRAAFAAFIVTHRSEGLRLALAKLLSSTNFRFVGVWLFRDGKAAAAVHVDRDNPTDETAAEVDDTATYCCFVRDSGEPFNTPNAVQDRRLDRHAARSTVLSYCGVPVEDVSGKVIGTLCLYDLRPLDLSDFEISLLAGVSGYLSLGGHIPSYPVPPIGSR